MLHEESGQQSIIGEDKSIEKFYDEVAVGGTFDGIHAGHKILLNEAAMRCRSRLTVGITSRDMIKSKVLWELIAPLDERIELVKSYLTELKPSISINISIMNDMYGPTIHMKELECLVVSTETLKGARLVNEARLAKGWKELELGVVNLVDISATNKTNDMMERLKEKKVSSSVMRLEKLGTILRPPKPNPSIPKHPYIIGLTGGVACGKTNVGKYMESLGFGYVNYDIMGHRAYQDPDSSCYKSIVEVFGKEVVSDNATIDRSKLGKIVFNDKEARAKLEAIVWPEIYRLVDLEIERLKDSCDVIVLESALLVESEQNKRCHQVWTVFVSVEEAIRRQVEERNISRDDAEKRIKAQLDNLTRIKMSNAVFCTQWEKEFTRYQVRKCIAELREKYLE